MATGKSGSFELAGTKGMTLKVFWEETYDIATNESVVYITNLQMKASTYTGYYYLDGTIKIDGTTAVTFSSAIGNHFIGCSSKNVYASVYSHKNAPPWTVSDIAHASDGSKSVTISVDVRGYTVEDNLGSGCRVATSKSVTLTTIPRASTLDALSCATSYFTGKLTYKYTPKSSSFYNRCNITLNQDGTYIAVKTINLGQKGASQQTATVTLSSSELETIYKKLPNATKGVLRFTFRTYSDSGYSNQVGDAVYKEVTLTIPDNSTTKADVSMSLAPVGSLPDAFAGLYIQGRTKVKATLSAEGKHDATIKSYSMKVDGITYDSDDNYTSEYLTKADKFTVYGYAKDSRGYTGSTSKDITVISYAKPKILDVVAARCDADGNLSDSGTYLKISAERVYSPVKSDDVQKNFCKIRYRYKLATATSYSAWTTILAKDNLTSDKVETDALLGGVLSIASSYHVQVQAIDDMGESASSIITVPTDRVYWHRDGARNSFTFGGYVEEDNTFAIAGGIDFVVKSLDGESVKVSDTGWIDLGMASSVSGPEADYDFGRKGAGCYYRVINGNHVYVAFNCACEYAGENIQVNATEIPSTYRPERYCYAMLPVGGKAVVRAFVSPTGAIKIDWIQSLTSGAAANEGSITWVDGYIDYWV